MSSAPADLEIARFAVGEVVGGTQTGRDAGTLHLSLPELAVSVAEPALAEATEIRIDGGVPLGNRSMELRRAERVAPFDGFHLAVTPKVLGG